MDFVWVFNGNGTSFPSGVFSRRETAEKWIASWRLSGILSKYPIDVGVYDWAIEQGFFRPKREYQKQPKFVERFSSASQEHYHYEEGGNLTDANGVATPGDDVDSKSEGKR